MKYSTLAIAVIGGLGASFSALAENKPTEKTSKKLRLQGARSSST